MTVGRTGSDAVVFSKSDFALPGCEFFELLEHVEIKVLPRRDVFEGEDAV